MKVTDEVFQGISGLIEMVVKDAVELHNSPQGLDDFMIKGLAHNVAAQICQNLEAEPDA